MEQQSEIRTVTEPEHFGQVIKDYYAKGHLFIKLVNDNLDIEFVKAENNNISFSAPKVKNLPEECFIVAKLDDELVYGTMKQIEQKKDIFTFTPVKFQVIKLFRRDHRIGLDSGGKQIIFINGIVSQIDLETDMQSEKKKVEQIKSKITAELGKLFDKIKIFVAGEKPADTRFRYFLSNANAIYIPDINAKDSGSDVSADEQHKYYRENIYATDYQLKSGNLISEITTPFLYKNQMPYGYIQINSAKMLASSTTLQLKSYISRIEQIFEKSAIFKPSEERFIVIDVSKGGFAIAFKDKKFLRLFQPNVSMCVNMLLADKDISMYVITRHITPDSKMITVGFQILTTENRDTYDGFINSLSPK
ncbi:MAG: hypothetical protein FWG13_06760 [Leptospirales bacterium]|nr:hypothetical protein [Leptospirales bacterium]